MGYSFNKVIYDNTGAPKDYEFVEMNKAYESIMGIQEKDWIGKNVSELYKAINTEPEDWDEFYRRVFTNHQNNDLEMNFKHLDKYYKIKIKSPKEDYIIISLTDISIELRESKKLKTLLDNVPIQVWYLSDATTYLSTNKIHADFIGFKSHELVNKDLKDILVETDANICINSNEEVFREKKQITSLEWTNNSHGEKKLLRITRNPKLNQEGDIEFVVCSAEDITEDYINKQKNEMQERILRSSMDFTQELLTNKNIEEALSNGIEMLGEATKMDRVYYWENKYNEESREWLTSRKIEWSPDMEDHEFDHSKYQDIPFNELDYFMKVLSQNNSFSCQVKDLDKEEKEAKNFLDSRGILSVLSIPIFVKDDFIGFIGFDSCKTEKKWSQVEISLLKSFVLLYEKALERAQLEREVKQTSKNFFNFFNMIRDLLIVFDYKGNIIDINETALEKTNYSREELLGMSYLKLHPKDDAEEKKDNFQDLIRNEIEHFSLNLVTKDGDILPVEATNSKGVWDGEPVIFSVGKDISELTLSEDKFSKAFNNSGVSMFISRFKDGKILEANETFLEFLGYTKNEVVGRTTLDLQIAKDFTKRDAFKQLIQTDEKILGLEINFIDKNNYIHIGLTNVVPVTINNEKCLLTSIIDISDRVENEKEIIELSTRDYLTNVYNRRFIYEVLGEIIMDSKREKEIFSVAIIDIDNFKHINDQYGHQIGDSVLVDFTKIIKDHLRSNDILGRYGGEEFIIVLNHSNIEESSKVLERVLAGIRDKVFSYGENRIVLTFSAGITCSEELEKDELTIDKLVETSDKRMYRAKKEGKNKIISKG